MKFRVCYKCLNWKVYFTMIEITSYNTIPKISLAGVGCDISLVLLWGENPPVNPCDNKSSHVLTPGIEPQVTMVRDLCITSVSQTHSA